MGAASGEQLHYDVRWLGVPAGRASMTMSARSDRYTLTLTLATTGMVRALHPITETLKAVGQLSSLQFRTHRYTKDQNRGSKNTFTTYRFDAKQRQVVRVKRESDRAQEERQTIPLGKAHTLDPLSGLYALRAWPKLLPHSTLRWFVVEGDQIHRLKLSVGGSYRLETVLGQVVAFPVYVAVTTSKKFFRADGKGGIVIWMTDDRRRMPVRVEAKLAFGSVVAELARFDDARGDKSP